MAKKDAKAPKFLNVAVTDSTGKPFGTVIAAQKAFSTGSVGFYGNAKLINPENPDAVYQVGLTFTLIGSKG